MGTMAQTIPPSQLASESARDGVDTRTKDNSMDAAAEIEETTRLGDGDQVIDGQTAANRFENWLKGLTLPDYIVPPGAEVKGTAAWAAWENWLDRVGPPKNMDYGYGGFSGYDDTEDHKMCLRNLAESVGPNSELFAQLYREAYNDEVASLKRVIADARRGIRECTTSISVQIEVDYFTRKILREIESCATALDDYHVEVLQQKFAASRLAQWVRTVCV